MSEPGPGQQRALVAAIDDVVYLQSLHLLDTGVWWAGEPVVRCAPEPQELTNALRAALAASTREGLRGPRTREEWRSVPTPLLTATGLRSWAALARTARQVDVDATGGLVTLTPMAPDRSARAGATRTLVDLATTLSATDHGLGAALLQATRSAETL